MKKILGLVLVLFFVFSLLPAPTASAGPAYERLKVSNIVVVTVHFLKEKCRQEFEKELSEGIDLMKNKTSDDPVSPEEYEKIDSRYCLGFECSTEKSGETEYYFLITRADKIFSNISFRETMSKYPGRFAKKISKILRSLTLEEHLYWDDLVVSDWQSKGFTEQELSHVIANMFMRNDPALCDKVPTTDR